VRRCDDSAISWVRPRSGGVSWSALPPNMFAASRRRPRSTLAFVRVLEKARKRCDPEKFAQEPWLSDGVI